MINIQVDEKELQKAYEAEIQKRLDQIELRSLLITKKELCRLLNLSYPTIEKVFMSDPKFRDLCIRIGTRVLFNRKEVEKYINTWSVNNRGRNPLR